MSSEMLQICMARMVTARCRWTSIWAWIAGTKKSLEKIGSRRTWLRGGSWSDRPRRRGKTPQCGWKQLQAGLSIGWFCFQKEPAEVLGTHIVCVFVTEASSTAIQLFLNNQHQKEMDKLMDHIETLFKKMTT